MIRKIATWLSAFVCAGVSAVAVDYHREIRPLLADACFRCHGFDAAGRKGGFRLDQRDSALQPAKSGARPIVPGQPEQSEVMRRLLSPDPAEHMPPETTHRQLTDAETALIRRWIAEGAEYPAHWAFQPIQHPALPTTPGKSAWARNGVDSFIQSGLHAHGWQPAPAAPAGTWLRRVSLDLTGLPPTPAELDAFLADPTPAAEEHAVDRLLASPRFGERMAQDWLDAARFADTNGYQVDRDREMWAWRDWVVRAFNRNLPFDTFTVEQIAGDLLPDATLDQKIATGFHRNHMINEEGGIIPEEFLAEYCADRVETTATVWLGLTMNCARCHDHKYDPLTQRDFYGLLAFFHNVPESGVGDYGANIRRSTPPFLKLPTPAQTTALENARAELATTSRKWTNLLQQLDASREAWEARAKAATPAWRELTASVTHAGTNPVPLHVTGAWTTLPNDLSPTLQFTFQVPRPRPDITALQIEWQTEGSPSNALAVAEIQMQSGDFAGDRPRTNRWTLTPVALTSGASVTDLNPGIDGKPDTAWHVHGTNVAAGIGTFLIQGRPPQTDPEFRLVLQFQSAESRGTWRFRVRTTELDPTLLLTPAVAAALAQPPAQRTAETRQQVEEFRRSRTPEHEDLRQQLARLNRQIDELDLATPITLVMSEMATPPRPTCSPAARINSRGKWSPQILRPTSCRSPPNGRAIAWVSPAGWWIHTIPSPPG